MIVTWPIMWPDQHPNPDTRHTGPMTHPIWHRLTDHHMASMRRLQDRLMNTTPFQTLDQWQITLTWGADWLPHGHLALWLTANGLHPSLITSPLQHDTYSSLTHICLLMTSSTYPSHHSELYIYQARYTVYSLAWTLLHLAQQYSPARP